VFVYVKPENVDEVETFLYCAEDIISNWKESEESYILYHSKTFVKERSNDRSLFVKRVR